MKPTDVNNRIQIIAASPTEDSNGGINFILNRFISLNNIRGIRVKRKVLKVNNTLESAALVKVFP